MSDMDREPERVRETHTTVVTGDGGRRGGGGWIIAVVLLLGLILLLFFLFRDGFNSTADKVGVNVNVEAPKIEVPDSVKIDIPDEVKVETSGNSAK
ncbi:MAG TPA: hypothetical protein VGB65_10275 [Allosphingosinicella sp.]|jgi:hypothetical protein